MPIELAAQPRPARRPRVAIAEALADGTRRAAPPSTTATAAIPFEAIDALKRRRLLRRPDPRRARRARRRLGPRPGRGVEPPGPRRRIGRDRREHAPGRGAQHRAPPPGRGRRRATSAAPARSPRRWSRSPARASCWPPRSASAARTSPGRPRSRPAPSPAGGSTAARCSARCRPPPRTCTSPSPTPTATAASATPTRWCPPDAPGVDRPRRLGRARDARVGQQLGLVRGRRAARVRRPRRLPGRRPGPLHGAQPGGRAVPRRGLARASPSRADAVARRGRRRARSTATRARACRSPTTRSTSPPPGASLSRAATLIDEHRRGQPGVRRRAEELSRLFAEAQAAKAFVNEAAARIVDRALALSGGAGYLNGSPLARAYRDVRAGGVHAPARRQPPLRLPRASGPR